MGTLGAVEYIPRLIEMLRDADPGVKEAVRKALDRLNQDAAEAAKPKKEG
ncbi:MAG: hypothetical protein O7B99_16085 [Planctomycetota bacterium]|nr:hypothetical protein [Planctomycetota bacterium]